MKERHSALVLSVIIVGLMGFFALAGCHSGLQTNRELDGLKFYLDESWVSDDVAEEADNIIDYKSSQSSSENTHLMTNRLKIVSDKYAYVKVKSTDGWIDKDYADYLHRIYEAEIGDLASLYKKTGDTYDYTIQDTSEAKIHDGIVSLRASYTHKDSHVEDLYCTYNNKIYHFIFIYKDEEGMKSPIDGIESSLAPA